MLNHGQTKLTRATHGLHTIVKYVESNYNRANGVAVCACVWQPTPRTADVTVTKIAGYVRVRLS